MASFTLKQHRQIQELAPDRLKANHLPFSMEEKRLHADYEKSRVPFEVNFPRKEHLRFYRLEEAPDALKESFSIDPETSPLKTFSFRSPTQVFFLDIPAGEKVETPVILKIKPTHSNLAFSLLVRGGADCRMTIIEDWTETVCPPFSIFSQQIHLEPDARMKWITLQNASLTSHLAEYRESHVEKGAELEWLHFHFGSKAIHSEILQHAGEEARTETRLAARMKDSQQASFLTENRFLAPHGRGEVHSKGVVFDSAHLQFHGGLHIRQAASGTQTYLSQDCLNLSENAIIDARPALAVDTNDVKAGHGASIRNLGDEELFYLKSRGLDEDSARKMMVSGFLKEEFAILPPELRNYIQRIL